MAKWGLIPSMDSQQELVSINKKIDTTIRELNIDRAILKRLDTAEVNTVAEETLSIALTDQATNEVEELIQRLNILKSTRRRLLSLSNGDE